MLKIGKTILGEGPVKICVPVMAGNLEELKNLAAEAKASEPDLCEWRMDAYEDLSGDRLTEALQELRDILGTIPVIATFRTAAEGGLKAISDEYYIALSKRVISSGLCDALDVEAFSRPRAAGEIIPFAKEKGIPVIGSNHDFTSTPIKEGILSRLKAMKEAGADIPKGAYMPLGEKDVETVFEAGITFKRTNPDTPFILISMGEKGQKTRIRAEEVGSVLTFASAGVSSAPGQISVAEMRAKLN